MKKYLFIAAMWMAVAPAFAQDTYENARLLGGDLNGTARYVGMGGALDALGADISTISTNPAGVGLFRHSTASLSLGAVSQQGGQTFDNLSKTNMSFDQAGFVWSNRTGNTSYVNFAFNYHKSRNFDQILSAANRLSGSSMSKLAFAKGTKDRDTDGGYYWDANQQGDIMGWRDANSNERAYPFTQWDYLYWNVIGYDDVNNEAVFVEADGYDFNRAHRGWIADYDFNLSGNSKNRFFWGITVGIHDVRYKGYSEYTENIVSASNVGVGTMTLADNREIKGTGADVKAGIIFRPIESSPFRIGLSVATPIWYDLTSENYTALYNNTERSWNDWGYDSGNTSEVYDFKYYTPWKFGISLGHTIGTEVAIGASYDYSDYSASDTRIIDGYDYYDNAETSSDRVMNGNTSASLKGVHTLKVGAELKPDPAFAVRLGYNFVSPSYQENGIRDTQLDSPGNRFSSTADYTNWKATHRVTCGLGYKIDKLSLDLAYQYNVTNGDFHPFQDNVTFRDPANNAFETNISTPTSVSNKRHQLLFTLGYTF